MDSIYIVVSMSPVDGVQVSSAFRRMDNAQCYALFYGGSVRIIHLQDDTESLTPAHMGIPNA